MRIAAENRRMRTFVRSQLRNIAPFLTLIVLLVFFSVASRSFATRATMPPIS